MRCDALVIGAGPAGLTAANYLARYRRSVRLIDAGRSRARYIPISRNCPGFAGGVSGDALLAELREQLQAHGLAPESGTVHSLKEAASGFSADTTLGIVEADAIVMATGVEDVLPPVPGIDAAIKAGVVRLCAICDAYELLGKRVGVYAPAQRVARHARYLRSFAAEITALVSDEDALREADEQSLHELDVPIVRATSLRAEERTVFAMTASGESLEFDAIYPYLGSKPRSAIALALGAACDAQGCLKVDANMETSVPSLYAIGDVVSELDQIAVGMGHAALAATAIHRCLPFRPVPL